MKGLMCTLQSNVHNGFLKTDEVPLTLNLRMCGWGGAESCQLLGGCQMKKEVSQTTGSLLK